MHSVAKYNMRACTTREVHGLQPCAQGLSPYIVLQGAAQAVVALHVFLSMVSHFINGTVTWRHVRQLDMYMLNSSLDISFVSARFSFKFEAKAKRHTQ